MKKIISLFKRNYETDHLVRNEAVEGAGWVLAGEGVATRKFDGTCCMIRGGKLYKRFDLRDGRNPPPGFERVEKDEYTRKTFGWVPVGDGPDDKWHREAMAAAAASQDGRVLQPEIYFAEGDFDGTYELCGPKIQGNPEAFPTHQLVRHGGWDLPDCPRDFDGIREYLRTHDIEGVVWWRSPLVEAISGLRTDCDKVKIKAKDFGFKRGGK